MGKISKVLEKSGYSVQKTMAEEVPSPVEQEPNELKTKDRRGSFDQVDVEKREKLSRLENLGSWDERLTKVSSFSNEISESFRVLRSKILMGQDGEKKPRSIMVTSVLPQEGKSFVSANLGIALAQGIDQYSLLVDCDLRLPSLARLFGVPYERGLVDFLRDDVNLSELIVKTSVNTLTMLPSGTPPINPAELLGSVRMHDLVEELSSRYPDRFVIYDSPPLQVASETMVLAQVVDGVVLVIRHGRSSKMQIQKVINDIGKHKILGVIFNGHTPNFFAEKLVNKSYGYYGNYYSRERS